MICKQHTADGRYQSNGTEEDGRLMVVQFIIVVRRKHIHDEDAVVHSDTENKIRDDDADEIEEHVEQYHCSKHDEPTE